MRILHLVSRSQRRGAEMVGIELAAELDALGHENRVVALTLALDGGQDPALPPLVDTERLTAGAQVQCSLQLRRALSADPVDLVLAHGGWPAQIAAFGMPRRRPTLVWQRILDFPSEFWHSRRLRVWREVAARVDAVAALTTDELEEMTRLGYEGPVWVIPNFRKPERFLDVDREKEGIRLREALSLDRDVHLIGFVGHLVRQKRPERALEVLASVRHAGRDAHLVIAGDGPLRPDIEGEITRRGIRDHVTLLGHRADVERIFGAVDLAVLTSDVEGIPGVVIEAAMTGCPVVTFPLGGVTMVVRDGITGVVLDRADTSSMADRVIDLLDDESTRERMGVEARQRSLEFSANRTASIYADRLAEAHAARAAREPARRRLPAARVETVAEDLARRGPNLFVIGAPRCGTTFIYHALRRAEGVFVSPVKQPGFFTSTREFQRGVAYYLDAYFAGAEGHRFRGEATPWYLYSDLARERIASLDLQSPPRLVVALRRPSMRAWSMFRDQRRKGADHRSFAEAVEDELALLDEGRLARDVRQRYVWCGAYAPHVQAWQAQFGRDNVHVVMLEEMAIDPESMWRELAIFLGWDLGPTPFDALDERDKDPSSELRWQGLTRALRSFEGRDNVLIESAKAALPPGLYRRILQQVSRHNRRRVHPAPASPPAELIGELDRYFAPGNERLAAILGRELPRSWSGQGDDPAVPASDS